MFSAGHGGDDDGDDGRDDGHRGDDASDRLRESGEHDRAELDAGAIDAPRRLDELAERGRQVATELAATQAELVAITAEVQRLEGSLAGATTREWLALQWGLTPAEAGRAVRLATRLAPLPQIRVEFEAGQLSEGTVDTLARVATPENEARLLATAKVATGAQLQTLVRDFERVTDAEEASPPAEPSESFDWWIDEHGMFRLRGRLAADRGASLASAIDAARAADLDDAGAGATPLTNAEALGQVADAYLTGTANADGIVPERFTTIVHVDQRGAHLHDGGHVDLGLAGQLVCESWITVVLTRDGQPSTITSRHRLATPTQHRALLARDRCCQYPGCGRTRHLRAHHVHHASQHGPTRLDNLVLLCPRHHRRIHQPGWQLRRRGHGWQFTGPRGPLTAPRAGRPPPGPHPPGHIRPRSAPAGDPLTSFGRDVVLGDWFRPD